MTSIFKFFYSTFQSILNLEDQLENNKNYDYQTIKVNKHEDDFVLVERFHDEICLERLILKQKRVQAELLQITKLIHHLIISKKGHNFTDEQFFEIINEEQAFDTEESLIKQYFNKKSQLDCVNNDIYNFTIEY